MYTFRMVTINYQLSTEKIPKESLSLHRKIDNHQKNK